MLKRLVVMVGCAFALTVSPARADVVVLPNFNCGTLLDVINDGCTIEDKLFTNVTFNAVGFDDQGDLTLAAGIMVTGITDPALNYGFGFRLTGLNGGPLVSAGGSLVATLGYTVSVVDPLAFLITDLHLGLDTTGNVLGVVSETATTLDLGAELGVLCVGTNELLCADLGLGNINEVVFGPVDALSVVKVLNLTSICNPLNSEDCGTVDSVDQIVTQQQVPEPASMMLFGAGLFGFAIRMRGRGRQQE